RSRRRDAHGSGARHACRRGTTFARAGSDVVSALGEAGRRDAWLRVKAGVLIDGMGGVARNAEMLVRGAVIVEVGPAGSIRVPPEVQVIDAGDATVIPGLIDCHLHVTYSGHVGMQQLEWPRSLELSAVS